MKEELRTVLIYRTAYRTVVLVVGLCFAFMGYQLFMAGVFGESDVEATWGSNKMLIKRASPGTLFAFFGAVLIIVSISKGFSAGSKKVRRTEAVEQKSNGALEHKPESVLEQKSRGIVEETSLNALPSLPDSAVVEEEWVVDAPPP